LIHPPSPPTDGFAVANSLTSSFLLFFLSAILRASDWTLRESARAKIKVLVKRILRKHGYPPDLQDEATKLVLQQAELLCAEWAA